MKGRMKGSIKGGMKGSIKGGMKGRMKGGMKGRMKGGMKGRMKGRMIAWLYRMDLSMLLERVEDPVYDGDEVVNLEPGSQSTLEKRIQTLKVHLHI